MSRVVLALLVGLAVIVFSLERCFPNRE